MVLVEPLSRTLQWQMIERMERERREREERKKKLFWWILPVVIILILVISYYFFRFREKRDCERQLNDFGSYYDKETKLSDNIQKCVKTLGENHPSIAFIFDNTGNNNLIEKKYGEAIKNYEKANKIRKDKLGNNHQDTKYSYAKIQMLNKMLEIYHIKFEYINILLFILFLL